MEEFMICNYVYHNLRDLLYKMNKLYPELIDDKILLIELECLKEYVSTLKIKKCIIDSTESTEKKVVAQISDKRPVHKGKKGKTVTPSVDIKTPLFTFDATQFQSESHPIEPEKITAPKKASHKSNVVHEAYVAPPPFTFDMTQFQVEQSQIPTDQTQDVSDTSCNSVQTQYNNVAIEKTIYAPTTGNTTCQCAARVIRGSRVAMSYDYISYRDNTTTSIPIYGRRCKNTMIDDGPFCAVHKKKCEYGIFTDEASAEVRELCIKKYMHLKELKR